MARESWTEERISQLEAKVEWGFQEADRRFQEVDRRFGRVEVRLDQIDQRLEKIDDRFEKVSEEFVAVRKEVKEGFEKLNGTMIWFAGILIAAFIVQGFALMIQAFAG